MIKQCTDMNLVKTMLLEDPELYDRIKDDYTKPELFDPSKSYWFGFYEEDECHGLGQITIDNAIVINFHINILKKYRYHSFEICSGILDYIIENTDKRIVKINAKIPSTFPDVIRFAEKMGFEQEGIDRKSILRNGEYIDRICFGKIIR